MAGSCGDSCAGGGLEVQRRVLVVVLAINAAMFVVEVVAGWRADSVSLQADALDFLGDSLNYAVTLWVLQRPAAWRAGAALVKGLVMMAFGAYVLGLSLVNTVLGSAPEAGIMGVVGLLALLANLAAAALLFRFRKGDANLRAVWLCSRNDAIGNLAVLAAAAGVFASGSPWPDLGVGLVIASLAGWAGASVARQALGEMRRDRGMAAP